LAKLRPLPSGASDVMASVFVLARTIGWLRRVLVLIADGFRSYVGES